MHHFYLMTSLKTSLKFNWLTVEFQLTDEKSTIHWKVKLWLFGQNQVSKVTFHQKCQNMKLIHQEIKKSRFHFENSKFSNLEIFLSVGNFIFFITLDKIFTMMKDDSRETSNMKVIDLHEIYNCALHNSFQKFLDLKL